MLVSRPAGREAYLVMSAYIIRGVPRTTHIEIDFIGVKVLAPGWADEVVTKLAEEFPHVTISHTTNSSVKATLDTLREYSGLKV